MEAISPEAHEKARVASNWWLILAVLAYVAIAVVVTFPFVIHPDVALTAPLSFDVAGSVSTFQTLVREHQNPFLTDHLTTIGWPAGVTIHPGVNREAWILTLYFWVASALFGAVFTHSLLNLLGLFLTAVVTCLFVRRVTGSVAAGFIAGLAYGFFPHMYLIGSAAPAYCWMGLLLLPIWGFYNLAFAPSIRNGVLAGLAPLPALFWTPYFALHVCVVTLACGVVVGIRALVLRDVGWKRLQQFAPAVLIPVAGLVVYVSIAVLSQFSGVPNRSVADAFQESAHPLMYVIPGWGSIWSNRPYDFLVRIVPRAKETNLYVGYSVILLTLVAFGVALRSLARHGTEALRSRLVVVTLIASAVVAFCFLFSLPPRLPLAGHSIPMPDALIVKVQPAFRGGQRFVMPLMGGMAVLAGLGFNALQHKVPRRAAPVLLVVVALLVWADLFAFRPQAVNVVPVSPALAVLRTQPSGPVFQYIPSDYSGRLPPINPCLLQPQYDKPVVDTCGLIAESDQFQKWIAAPNCTSLIEMRSAGVRYVIVDDSLGNLLQCFGGDLGGSNRQVADDGKLSVYELT